MGGFGGNAGLLSAWFNEETWEWQFEFVNCALGKQYLWWFVHIIDLITIGAVLVYAIFSALVSIGAARDTWPTFIASRIGLLNTPSKTQAKIVQNGNGELEVKKV